MSLDNLKQSENQKRTNLAQWRLSRTHPLDLPSGLSVLVRDADMTDLLLTGKLPPVIINMAKEAAEEGKQEIDLEKIGLEMMEKNSQDFLQMLNTITSAVLVEPQIGEQSDDAHITLAELPMTDKIAIMDFTNRGAEKIRSFRESSDQPVSAI